MKFEFRPLGAIVALAAGAYFAVYAYRALATQDLNHLLQPHVIASTIGLTALYMLLIPLTATAWVWLLRGLGQPVRFASITPILAVTQFGKYLPGNVAHHLGRVFICRKNGVDTGTTLASMAYETLLTAVACAHVSALTFLWSPPAALAAWPFAAHQGLIVGVITAGALAAMMIAPYLADIILRRRPSREGSSLQTGMVAHPGWLVSLRCYFVYVMNFALVGFGLWLAAGVLSEQPGNPILFVGAFASSWILGFLAPGAPAGLGVREAVLSMWLGTALAAADVVALIIMLRIATTLGDLLTFLWGGYIQTKQNIVRTPG